MLDRAKAFLLPVLLVSSLYANPFPECVDSSASCWGNWTVDAQWIYFKPSFDDTYFVFKRRALLGAPAERVNNDFDFHPGFRVGVAYDFADCYEGGLQAYYTRLKSQEHLLVGGPEFLSSTLGVADVLDVFSNYLGTARSDLDFFYQRFDGFYSYPLLCTPCIQLESLIGLECAYNRLREVYHYRNHQTGDFFIWEEEAKIRGIGPQFGLNFEYLLCQTACWYPGALFVVANSSGSLLVSKSNMQLTYTSTNLLPIEFFDKSTWRILPALHARAGLNYTTQFSCWGTSLEIGYEFNSYIRALSRYGLPADSGEQLCYTYYYSIDLHGLYVALNASF